ncbi:hypothetical protein C8R46DRAFT_1231217 [Mycena filopes]|nr:hypothetical protein C8R46DRAFT_1231217 [Mycena filopes]
MTPTLVGKSLLRFLSGPSRRIGNGQPPQVLLPTELWELVFHHISADEDLLRIATVCATFNGLCIHLFLARNLYPSTLFACHTPPFILSLVLPALHLSFRTFSFERFHCELGPTGLHRDLQLVGEIIHRSANLRDLGLFFGEDVFSLLERIDPPSRRTLMQAFCSILATMAKRVDGPVIFLSPNGIRSCRPPDIADWNLDLFQFNAAWRSRLLAGARDVLHLKAPKVSPHHRYFGQTELRLHTGRTVTVKALAKLTCATIQKVADDSGPLRHFTLLVFNPTSITELTLDELYDPLLLSQLVRHIVLPRLRHLTVDTDNINASALRVFLSTHPTIEYLTCHGRPGKSELQILVDPPLAHPGLRAIESTTTFFGRVLGCLITSPQLNEFHFEMGRSIRSSDLARLLTDLRHLSTFPNHTSLILDADIDIDVEVFQPWISGAEALEVAPTLQSVRSLRINGSVEIALATLPWLALLPAAVDIQFELGFLWPRPQQSNEELSDERTRVLAAARAALPHARITCVAY